MASRGRSNLFQRFGLCGPYTKNTTFRSRPSGLKRLAINLAMLVKEGERFRTNPGCAGYRARPFSKEAVLTPECRRCHPSFPAFLPGSRSPKEGPGCPDHEGCSACLPSTIPLCPGGSRLHLLSSRYGSEVRTGFSTIQRQGSCHSNHLPRSGGQQLG